MSTLYKIECDLFEDQSECWPDDLLFLPHAGIDTMLDALVEQIRRSLAVDPDFPAELLPKVRQTMRIVPALEGEAAHAYYEEQGLLAIARNEVRRAFACKIWQRTLELEGES